MVSWDCSVVLWLEVADAEAPPNRCTRNAPIAVPAKNFQMPLDRCCWGFLEILDGVLLLWLRHGFPQLLQNRMPSANFAPQFVQYFIFWSLLLLSLLSIVFAKARRFPFQREKLYAHYLKLINSYSLRLCWFSLNALGFPPNGRWNRKCHKIWHFRLTMLTGAR